MFLSPWGNWEGRGSVRKPWQLLEPWARREKLSVSGAVSR